VDFAYDYETLFCISDFQLVPEV